MSTPPALSEADGTSASPSVESIPDRLFRPGARDLPARRPLQIYSFDPMLADTPSTMGPGIITVPIPWEPLQPGPCGARVEVIDFDGGRSGPSATPAPADGRPSGGYVFYQPVDLDDRLLAVQSGLPPTEGDPRFHQQMVYAVTMNALEAYDRAFGRRIRLLGGRLRLFPHAFHGQNAYYDPDLRAVLFGYFEADPTSPGPNLPGQPIFTALSHDIISHEVTHALIHRVRPMLLYQTNPDVAAFHEAIADLVAIQLHFGLPGVVEAAIGMQPDLAKPTLLSDLAGQFGYATGHGQALRTALDVPDPTLYLTEMEPHSRGSILVGALFDTFLTVYRHRTADLIRIATGGTGVTPQGALHPDLVNRLSREARRLAEQLLNICLRALDYLPPCDVTFSDYLRAIVTSDRELFPSDGGGLRLVLTDAFRRRGIYPQDVISLADGALVWPVPADQSTALPPSLRRDILALDTNLFDPFQFARPYESDGSGQTGADRGARAGRPTSTESPASEHDAHSIARDLHAWFSEKAASFDLCPGQPLAVRGFHSTFRYDENGAPHLDFVIQLTQALDEGALPGADGHLRAGVQRAATVVFDEHGQPIRLISKPMPGPNLPESARDRAQQRLTAFQLWWEQLADADPGSAYGLTPPKGLPLRINFAALHGRTR